jgi:hypothetical protein
MTGPYTNYSLLYTHIKHFNIKRLSPSLQEHPGDVYTSVNVTTDFRQTVSFDDTKTLFVAFAIMRAGPGYLSGDTDWGNSTPSAFECALFFCVNSYLAVVTDGHSQESIVQTQTIGELGSWRAADLHSTEVDANIPGYKKWDEDHP